MTGLRHYIAPLLVVLLSSNVTAEDNGVDWPEIDFETRNGEYGVQFTPRIPEDWEVNSYWWEFGDGQISNRSSPCHNFGGSGSFKVTLTVEMSNETTSLEVKTSKYLQVQDGRIVDGIGGPITFDEGGLTVWVFGEKVHYTQGSLMVGGVVLVVITIMQSREAQKYARRGFRDRWKGYRNLCYTIGILMLVAFAYIEIFIKGPGLVI